MIAKLQNNSEFSAPRLKPSVISTARLNALLRLHRPPIKQVVFLRPYPVNLVGDLILRRASHLDAFSGYLCQTLATQLCRWHDSWHTRGLSTPVLSY